MYLAHFHVQHEARIVLVTASEKEGEGRWFTGLPSLFVFTNQRTAYPNVLWKVIKLACFVYQTTNAVASASSATT